MNIEIDKDEDVVVVERPNQKLVTKPPKYKVIYHNDDFTPMEFVVQTLQFYFAKTKADATSIMVEVHEKGKGIAGIYDFQMAETKIYETMMAAKEHAYPLLVTGELNE